MTEKKSYWEDPKYFAQRRRKIYDDKIAGMSNAELVKKYGISQGRILNIFKKVRSELAFKGANKDDKDNK